MVLKKEKFINTTQEQYERIIAKYSIFHNAMGNPNVEPVSPYNPLSQKAVEELKIIREVSKELQKKKEEDINKAAQAAKEAEEAANKAAEDQGQEEEKTE